MKRAFQILVLIAIANSAYSSCHCIKPTYKFLDQLNLYSFVALVEVIEMDTVNWGFPEKLGNRNDCITTETYVRARIHQQYFGEFIGKEVLIRNSNGLDCYGTLNFQNKGELFIIKGMTGYKGHEELVSTTPLKSEIVHLSICDYNTVRINELDQLEGWINKRPSIKHRKWTKFWKIVSFGLIQRKQRTDYHYKQQTMTITEFNDLIKRKYNTVTNT